MNYSELENKIDLNKSIDFGDILSKSLELFKKTWKQGLLHMLLSILVVVVVMVLIMIPLGAIGLFDPTQFQQSEPSPLFILTMMITMFPAIFLAVTVSMLLNAAFFRMIKHIDLEESGAMPSFGMFVSGKYIQKALVLSLITSLIATIAAMACYLPLFYVIVPLNLLGVIFAYNPDMGYSDLLKASFNLGNKKWLIAFGLMIVSGILAEIVGLLACGVGIFITASFMYLPLYYIYKDAIGFSNDDDSINKIGVE